ncbi:MAG: 6-phosphogluconolactonase [Planctomycetota bacterium]|jgi:6-phosphogluconolactonase
MHAADGPRVEVLADAEACARRAAELIGAWIAADSTTEARETEHLMLAGGSTPRRCYELLATRPELPWNRVQVWMGDERRVPPDDPQRNVRLIEETLVAAGCLKPRAVHTIGKEADAHGEAQAEHAARAYERLLPSRVDVLLLGVGADGHTASLFPDSPALTERSRRIVPARAPMAPHDRWTITPPVIEAARHVLVLATGADKTRAVAAALQDPPDVCACPAQLARRGTWILDRAAAARLHGIDMLPP